MRKIILVLPFFLSMAIVACGPSKAEKAEQEAKEQALKDSIAQDSIKRVKEKQDSIDWVTFSTPDLRLCGLHGHVKSVDDKGYGWKLDYDKDGKLTKYWFCSYDTTDKYKLIRDKKGVVTKMVLTNPDAPVYETEVKFTYDAEGVLRKYAANNGHEEEETIVDNEGRPVLRDGNEYYMGEKSHYKTSYKYTKFDMYGNWTECILTIKEKTVMIDDETGEFPNENAVSWKNGKTITIKRTIEYYER